MPPEAGRPRVAVVGGGIAGLAAAHALVTRRPDIDVTVYEGSALVGGKLRLGEVAGQPVDLGAEAMLNRRPEGTALARAVGLDTAIVHPRVTAAGVWTRGAVRPLPTTVMGIPADISAAATGGLLSRVGRVRAEVDRWLPAPGLQADIGVGRLVARRLGAQVRDRLVEPMLGGVYAGRSDDISLHAALPQVAAELRAGSGLVAAARSVLAGSAESAESAGNGKRPVFAGIDGGVGNLPAAVARDLLRRGAVVRCSTMVRGLDPSPSGWRLVVGSAAQPEEVSADAVIVAVPAVAAARLLRSAAPQAAHELAGIEYASVAVVTMAMRASDVSVELAGSGFLVPAVDGRAIKAATYSSQKWGWLRDDLVVIRCSVGRHGDETALQRSDTELVRAAAGDLRDAAGVRAPLLDANVTRWGGGLPQYAVGHLERVRRIRASVAAVPGLEICGAAFEGVGIPAVIATGTQAAAHLLQQLGEPRQ